MMSQDWIDDCKKWRGEVLTGKYGHWCNDWDGLPIDETCSEWPCICARKLWQLRIKSRMRLITKCIAQSVVVIFLILFTFLALGVVVVLRNITTLITDFLSWLWPTVYRAIGLNTGE